MTSSAMPPEAITTAETMVDYYQLLDLQQGWDADTLRKALLKAFRETKSRVNAASGKKLEEIELRLKWIANAKGILVDPDAKSQYDRELSEWKKNATSEQKAAAAAIPTLSELWALIDAGRYLDAVEAGKRLINHEPENGKAWEVYAYASYRWSDLSTAIYAAEQSIRCNPSNAEYYADAGQYLAAAERWNEACTQLNRAIQIDPNNVGYKLTLSNIYIAHESWSDAEAVLQGVLSQEPSNQTARSFLAIVLGSQAEARFPEIDALLEANNKREARKVLKEVQQQFEKARKLAEADSELKDLLNSESILVRRVLGVNFYRRILGVFIDEILMVPGFALTAIGQGNNPLVSILGMILVLGSLGYSWVWLAYKNNGQDLTKRLLGMQIVSDSDSPPSLGQLIGRALVKPMAIGMGMSFPALVMSFSMLGAMSGESDFSGAVGLVIGLTIGLIIMSFKIGFDLFFVTSKDLLPNFFGYVLFMHEHLTKTTVVASTQDDFLNVGEYHWY
jgi:tetratricopeptide (TPR) repeat protein